VLHGLVLVHTADETLDVEEGLLGAEGGLVLGGVTDEAFAGFVPSNVGGGDTVTLFVGNDFNLGERRIVSIVQGFG
jgi:hypothetical protein